MRYYKVVFDTNVVLAALQSSRGASFQLLALIGEDDRFHICLSPALALEYEDVLYRHLDRMTIRPEAVEDVLDYLCATAARHRIYFSFRPSIQDPGDEMIVDLAVAGGCDFIVTFNRRDFAGIEQFGIRAITPGEFLLFCKVRTNHGRC